MITYLLGSLISFVCMYLLIHIYNKQELEMHNKISKRATICISALISVLGPLGAFLTICYLLFILVYQLLEIFIDKYLIDTNIWGKLTEWLNEPS